MKDKIQFDKLSIAVFAEIVGTSKQNIYKSIKNENSKLYPYVVYSGKTPFIKIEAVEEVYKIDLKQVDKVEEVEQEAVDKVEEVEQNQVETVDEVEKIEVETVENSKAENQLQFDPTQIIRILENQLAEKDKQIERIQKQAEADKEEIKKLTELLANAQTLQAQSNVLLLDKNNSREARADDIEEIKEPIEEEAGEQPRQEKKKIGFWDWLTGNY